MCVIQGNFRKCIFLVTGPRFHQFLLIFELIRSKLLIFFSGFVRLSLNVCPSRGETNQVNKNLSGPIFLSHKFFNLF